MKTRPALGPKGVIVEQMSLRVKSEIYVYSLQRPTTPYHVHVHDYWTRADPAHSNGTQCHVIRVKCTVHVHHCTGTAVHAQATTHGVGVAQKLTRSGNAHAAWSMQIMHSEGQCNGARWHNIEVHCTAVECATRMLAVHVGNSEAS